MRVQHKRSDRTETRTLYRKLTDVISGSLAKWKKCVWIDSAFILRGKPLRVEFLGIWIEICVMMKIILRDCNHISLLQHAVRSCDSVIHDTLTLSDSSWWPQAQGFSRFTSKLLIQNDVWAKRAIIFLYHLWPYPGTSFCLSRRRWTCRVAPPAQVALLDGGAPVHLDLLPMYMRRKGVGIGSCRSQPI